MRLLLDTNALVWFYLDDPQLSATAKAAIVDPANQSFVSPASYWELAIKVSIGKYVLKESFADFLQHAVFDNGFTIVPIETKHAVVVASLPFHHRDPFDRLLVAQANVDGLHLVSTDKILDQYPITRVW